jgi:hypothetical protein
VAHIIGCSWETIYKNTSLLKEKGLLGEHFALRVIKAILMALLNLMQMIFYFMEG